MSGDRYYFRRSNGSFSGSGTYTDPFLVAYGTEGDDQAAAIMDGVLRMEYAIAKEPGSAFLLSGASMATFQTGYVGGWTFTNTGASGLDWTGTANVGSVPSLTYATVSSGVSKFLTGTSGYPDLGLPENADPFLVDVNIRWGPTGGLVGAGRPFGLLLFDGTNFGSVHSFNLEDIEPGSVNQIVSKNFEDWGLTTPERIAAWLAQPSLAVVQLGTGSGTPRIDAATVQVSYLAPLSPAGGYNRLRTYAKRRSQRS